MDQDCCLFPGGAVETVVCPGQVTGVELGAAVGLGGGVGVDVGTGVEGVGVKVRVGVKVGVGNIPAGTTGFRLHPVAIMMTLKMNADRQTNNVFNRICYTPMSYDEMNFPAAKSEKPDWALIIISLHRQRGP